MPGAREAGDQRHAPAPDVRGHGPAARTCPKGWMSPVGYVRYLKVSLAKMRQRQAHSGKSGWTCPAECILRRKRC